MSSAAHDTRSNWICFIFVAKYRYNVFRKQSTINVALQAFKELESSGYKFGEFGFAGNHVHFEVNVPEQYNIRSTKRFLKSYTARRIFEAIPGFRKRYPKGSFWSGYEHHQGFGRDAEANHRYVRSQTEHHGIVVIDDTQKSLKDFS